MIQSVSIAGAGIGGLTAAIAFARKGLSVSVYEQACELTDVGGGIQLSPNAARVLIHLGLGDALKPISFEPERALIRHWSSGAQKFAAPLKDACQRRYGAPYLHLHRADLHKMLVDEAQRWDVKIHLGAQVRRYEQTPDGIWLTTAQGKADASDLLIGADGLNSTIRTQMLGHARAEFTGQLAWRGTVPTAKLPVGLVSPDSTVWAGPNQHFVSYFVRGGSLVNFVAVQEGASEIAESWSTRADIAQVRSAFAAWHPAVTTLLQHAGDVFLWGLYDRKELPQWSQGRAVLLGDACHPALPFMAQGAAMAIEDAVILANRIVQSRSLTNALDEYETLRKPRTTYLQNRARANAGLFHQNGGICDVMNTAKLWLASNLPGALSLKPLDTIYGYDATDM